MKFGIPLGGVHPGLWPELTRRAEELGFESVWLPEHLVLPAAMSGSPHHGDAHPPVPPQTPMFDALNYLSFLAGQTSIIRLGTYVYNIGLRRPFISARAAATLDIVSAGRFDFGVGVSWLCEELGRRRTGFRHPRSTCRRSAAGVPCAVDRTDDRTPWPNLRFDEVAFEPKPVQSGGPQLHIGGDGIPALRRVARFGDGWLPMNHTMEQIPESVRTLTRLWDEHNRIGRPQVTTSVPITSAGDVQRAADVGIDRLIVAPWRRTREALDGITNFADELFAEVG